MSYTFPRTNVAGVSLSRMIIGTNWLLGWSHRSASADEGIKSRYRSADDFFPILKAYTDNGVDTLMAPISTQPLMIDAIEGFRQKYGRNLILVDTPIINVDDNAKARKEAENQIKYSASLGCKFCLIHHSSAEQLVNKNKRSIERISDYTQMIRDAGMIPGLSAGLNGIGQGIVDAFRTDTRNMTLGTATLTQPLFMGGKIIAYNKITKYAEQLAQSQHATGMQDLILNTDQAYWQVISLVNKKKLAESYVELVRKLDSDVEKMVAEGVATQADGLSVKVKVNEAEMTLTQVENGLSLSKMVLCQLCGLPLDSEIRLADEQMENLSLPNVYTESNVNTALANREELRSLELASQIYRQKVNVVRADFLPSVAFTANYLVTNPSLINGFENKFRGMWAAGVVVKIPVFHWGEGIYKVRAAKAEANIARYQLEDVREKVELQVTQSSYKVNEASKRLIMAEKNMDKANENLRYANLGFKEGVISTSNVLEAQTAWLSAQSGKIDAQIDLKMSEVYLNKSMGTLK